jgi:hypothetical protein
MEALVEPELSSICRFQELSPRQAQRRLVEDRAAELHFQCPYRRCFFLVIGHCPSRFLPVGGCSLALQP